MGRRSSWRGFRNRVKKKELKKSLLATDLEFDRARTYKSIFDTSKDTPPFYQSQFIPPETFSFRSENDLEDLSGMDLKSMSSWDVAMRYHEFKSKKKVDQSIAKQLRRMSASAILEKAQAVLGSVVHPVDQRGAPWLEVPFHAEQVDFDFEETLENSPLSFALDENAGDSVVPLTEQDIWMIYSVHRRQPIVLTVDTSLSMTGEKLALTAVALAVVLLEFPDDPIGIIAFENEAKVIKRPDERISIPLLVERFLDVPAQGYTHLEDGMKAALSLVRAAEEGGKGRPPSTVLLTDGKYTAGKDPEYLAARFPHLVVLKMGTEQSSFALCRDLAKRGRGALREVAELESLPLIMYGVVKDLLRGRSIHE